ncbi:MAG: hypothetical protein M1448_03065 [Candidatus Marsarchaeota archaeon]|jgi:hypothetical protein|nr:hypothetical protein [Candidatus Marsarchaeota archaeon]
MENKSRMHHVHDSSAEHKKINELRSYLREGHKIAAAGTVIIASAAIIALLRTDIGILETAANKVPVHNTLVNPSQHNAKIKKLKEKQDKYSKNKGAANILSNPFVYSNFNY